MLPALAAWHPFIVHFAVALTLTSAVLDAVDLLTRKRAFERTAFTLAMLALPCLVAAVVTGNLASQFIDGSRARAVLELHQTYANIAVWLFSGAAVWRLFLQLRKAYAGMKKILYVLVILAAALCIFLTAEHGGAIRHQPYAMSLSRIDDPRPSEHPSPAACIPCP